MTTRWSREKLATNKKLASNQVSTKCEKTRPERAKIAKDSIKESAVAKTWTKYARYKHQTARDEPRSKVQKGYQENNWSIESMIYVRSGLAGWTCPLQRKNPSWFVIFELMMFCNACRSWATRLPLGATSLMSNQTSNWPATSNHQAFIKPHWSRLSSSRQGPSFNPWSLLMSSNLGKWCYQVCSCEV